jgi:predicted RNA-binding protein
MSDRIASTYWDTDTIPAILPYLQPREIDNVLDAIDDGRLAAVAQDGEILAVATPAAAEMIVRSNQDAVEDLLAELREAIRELGNLRTIVGEVMVEKDPAEHVYRIEEAIDDVSKAINGATDYAENL